MRDVLFVTLSNIGDVVMTTPVVVALKRLFPDSRLTVVTGPRARGMLSGSSLIDELVIYDKKAGFGEKWSFLKKLREKSYECVVDLRNTAIPFLVRSKKRSPFWRHFKHISKAKRHLEVLEMMGYRIDLPLEPFDFFHEQERLQARQKAEAAGVPQDRPWLMVAPVAASELKTWKLEGFKAVLERLLSETEGVIVLVGDERERALAEPLKKICPSRVFNLAGETTLRELCALIQNAHLLLTNDSAVMHIGYELHRPVVAVFGPTHHEKYGRTGPRFKIVREPVFCSPCEQPTCRFSRQACFEDLNPERVISACQELLHEFCRP